LSGHITHKFRAFKNFKKAFKNESETKGLKDFTAQRIKKKLEKKRKECIDGKETVTHTHTHTHTHI
jgi:hypothetical protein